jgi:hypothetical protein
MTTNNLDTLRCPVCLRLSPSRRLVLTCPGEVVKWPDGDVVAAKHLISDLLRPALIPAITALTRHALRRLHPLQTVSHIIRSRVKSRLMSSVMFGTSRERIVNAIVANQGQDSRLQSLTGVVVSARPLGAREGPSETLFQPHMGVCANKEVFHMTTKATIGQRAVTNRYNSTQRLLGNSLNADEMLAMHKLLWANDFKVYAEGSVRFTRPGFDLNEHPVWLQQEQWAAEHADRTRSRKLAEDELEF